MAQDEQLREALLELQILRDREAKSLSETQTLLESLEAYTAADQASGALSSVFLSLHNKIGSALTLIVEATDGEAVKIIAADKAVWLGQGLPLPFDPFGRARAVFDMHLLGEWGEGIAAAHLKGLIAVPVSSNQALLTFSAAPRSFRKDDMGFVTRLSGLAAQAYRNSLIEAENALLTATIADSSSGIAISDAQNPENPLVYVNRAFEALSGYSAEEVLGQNCRFLSAEPYDSPERNRLRQAVRTATGGEFLLRNKRKSGEEFWNELTLAPVYDAAGKVKNLVATQSDATERVEAAAERDQVRERMESALAATHDAFIMIDENNQVAFANPAAHTLFPAPGLEWETGTDADANWQAFIGAADQAGYTMTGLVRHATLDLLKSMERSQEIHLPNGRSALVRTTRLGDGGLVVSASDVTAIKEAQSLLSQRLAAIEAAPDGIAIEDETGALTYVNSVGATLLAYDSQQEALGKNWRAHYPETDQRVSMGSFTKTLNLDGDAGQPHEITSSPLEGGGNVILIRDMGHSLEIEAREAELTNELIRLQRQETISQLTAGVAHDFNNLLAVVNGSATLIGMTSDLPEETTKHVERISAAGVQATKLVSRLLDVGSDSDADDVFELASLFADLPNLVQSSLPSMVTLSLGLEVPTMALRGSLGTLSQILINLILNARDALDGTEGHIQIEVEAYDAKDDQELTVGGMTAGTKYAKIIVQDNGPGMGPETAAQIFQPYFTTKGRQGTGLGLATGAMQIRSIGGGIDLKTALGEGATFILYWPLATLSVATPEMQGDSAVDLSGLTILVVDDDAGVGSVVSAYMEALGAEVAACEDPRDALEVLEDGAEGWSALITDYDMPHLSGGALVEKVRQIAPDLPIFVVTALAKRLSDPRVIEGKVQGILPKPINLSHLSHVLAATLN